MQSPFMMKVIPHRKVPAHFVRGALGVFFLFMPVGFQVEMLRGAESHCLRGLAQAVVAAAIATAWFALGTLRLWWFVPVMLVGQFCIHSIAFPRLDRSPFFQLGSGLSPHTNMTVLFTLSIVTLGIGFAMLVRTMVSSVRRSEAARAELDIARQVHESIVPPIDLRLAGVHVFARSRTSSTMGGDLIDVVQRVGEVDVFVADVSGHGVKAGIVMAMLKAAVRTRLAAGGNLGEILQDVNRSLADLTEPSMFATLACVRIRFVAGGAGADVEYALAGHLPIFHVLAADGSVRDLPNESLPLGIEPAERYVAGRTTAARGDVLALMTDGLMEVQGKDGREFGLGALRETVRSKATSELASVYSSLMVRVDAHGAQVDDQTLALVRIG
jgi:serine phosphatase RsbU (regulator of sigma subunit)